MSDEIGATTKFEEEVEVFEGVDFTKFVDVSFPTLEEVENRATLTKAKGRRID